MIDYDAIWLSQVYAINRFFIYHPNYEFHEIGNEKELCTQHETHSTSKI